MADERRQPPLARDTPERVRSALDEAESRFRGVTHRLRDEYLPGLRKPDDPSADVDREARALTVDDVAIAGVQANTERDLQRPSRLPNRAGGRERVSDSGEHSEEPVTCRVHLAAAERRQFRSDDLVVPLEQLRPFTVAKPYRQFRRTDDVREQRGCACAHLDQFLKWQSGRRRSRA